MKCSILNYQSGHSGSLYEANLENTSSQCHDQYHTPFMYMLAKPHNIISIIIFGIMSPIHVQRLKMPVLRVKVFSVTIECLVLKAYLFSPHY